MVHNPTVEMAKQCKTMQTIAKNQTLLRELNQKQPAMDFNHQTLTTVTRTLKINLASLATTMKIQLETVSDVTQHTMSGNLQYFIAYVDVEVIRWVLELSQW